MFSMSRTWRRTRIEASSRYSYLALEQVAAEALGTAGEQRTSNVNNELWLSSVSVWEALVLMQKDRVQVENPFGWVGRAKEQSRQAP